ncbi:WecB/TagA/CpsF family glycosyltransferase, partial [bacterium]|nr:WecB/TagA/CpsF family glycosyltransferase [bacterium]
NKEEEKEIIAQIREKRPDILFVGMGAINQEKWIDRHLCELKVPVCIGVGGSFDVVSGRLKRAPLWMMNRGFEWLYRLLIQPWRILRIMALPSFVFSVFVDKITLNDEK